MPRAATKRKANGNNSISKRVSTNSSNDAAGIDMEDIVKLYPRHSESQHTFSVIEAQKIRQLLLHWYDQAGRDLPWRRLAKQDDVQQRAYCVWVSEIMCQQTRYANVHTSIKLHFTYRPLHIIIVL